MYYYKGEELGGFDVAYDRIYEDKGRTRELVRNYIDTFTEDYAKGLLSDIILSGHPPNRQTMIESALEYMADAWPGMKKHTMPGSTYDLGDFGYEDWEGKE